MSGPETGPPRSGLVEVSLGVQDRDPKSSHHGPSAKVKRAAAAVLADGAVLIRDAVDPHLLERLSARMDEDLAQLLLRPDRPVNFVSGHLQQDPPPAAELLTREVLAHPFAVRVCREVLRQPYRLTGLSNNTNLAGSWDQPVHVDEGQLWPGLAEAHPPASLIVNIPLSDVLPGQGAIELWPGTHLDPHLCRHTVSPQEGTAQALRYLRTARRAGATTEAQQESNRRVGLTVPDELLEARRAERPPVSAATKTGTMIIRDPRLWHRGTANGAERRFMIALTYDPGWRRSWEPLRLPVAVKQILDAAGLEAHADYSDGPMDHLNRHVLPDDSPLRRVGVPTGLGGGR